MDCMSRIYENRPFCKMAAILALGKIWNVPISKNLPRGIVYQCTKFHAFIINSTILSHICRTIYMVYKTMYTVYTISLSVIYCTIEITKWLIKFGKNSQIDMWDSGQAQKLIHWSLR